MLYGAAKKGLCWYNFDTLNYYCLQPIYSPFVNVIANLKQTGTKIGLNGILSLAVFYICYLQLQLVYRKCWIKQSFSNSCD